MKKQLLGGLVSVAMTTIASAPAMSDVSATAGFVSDYVYRGSEYGDAAAYFSVDYEQSGFFAGAWAIMDGGNSVNDDGSASGLGTEIDYYFGYGMEMENGFNFSLGYTAYTYSYSSNYLEDFEDEIGGSIGFAGFGASAYYGWDHNTEIPEEAKAETFSYTYFDLSWSGEVFGALIGRYQNESKQAKYKESYNYFELSAGGEVATLDMSVTYGKKFAIKYDGEKASDVGNDYIVLDISKTFSL